jgi:hypothetical protein
MNGIPNTVLSVGEPIDVVYVFRNTTDKVDTELFYSLRSLKKYLSDYRNIYVIGDTPRFAEPVGVAFKHIVATDPFQTSVHNVRHKLKLAIADSEISETFLLMNDDFFFLTETVAPAVPYFKSGSLQQHIEWREEQSDSPYVRALAATRDALVKHNHSTRDFEVHAPILFEKGTLGTILGDDLVDWSATYGYVIRSLYCNFLEFTGERCMDLKIDYPVAAKDLQRIFATSRFLSTGPGGLKPPMLAKFAMEYPG